LTEILSQKIFAGRRFAETTDTAVLFNFYSMLFQYLYCSISYSSRFQTTWMFGMAALYF
jgi:hypothetical protein